jgi:hypothetical protein
MWGNGTSLEYWESKFIFFLRPLFSGKMLDFVVRYEVKSRKNTPNSHSPASERLNVCRKCPHPRAFPSLGEA